MRDASNITIVSCTGAPSFASENKRRHGNKTPIFVAMGVTALVLLGGFICFYIVTEANGLFFFSESGPGDQRSAEVGQFVTSVEIPEEVLLCSHAKWNHDEEGIWSFQQIAGNTIFTSLKVWFCFLVSSFCSP